MLGRLSSDADVFSSCSDAAVSSDSASPGSGRASRWDGHHSLAAMQLEGLVCA